MSGPQRIQLRRTKGWRMPANTVKVTRGPGMKWGNPFKVGHPVPKIWLHMELDFADTNRYLGDVVVPDAAEAMRLFRKYEPFGADLSELRGKNLACFCPLDRPCHADVLLELANSPQQSTGGAA